MARQLLALAAVVASNGVALLVGRATGRNLPGSGTPNESLSRVVLATALGTLWPLAFLVHRCYGADIIGNGSEEFRRIGVAGWIDEPQIPEHGGNRLARDLDHALSGTGHG